MRNFLAAGDSKKARISTTLRAMMRNIQPFIPRAATTNRKLARHCFLTSYGNYMCKHHQSKAKRKPVIDGANQTVGGYAVTGVPHPRLISNDEMDNTPAAGYMNCGCNEEDVLTEFFYWKTWTITSPTTGVVEHWLDQAFDPRARAFVVTAHREASRLTLNDLYAKCGDEDEHRRQLLRKQIARLQLELEGMREKEEVSLLD